MLLKVRHFVAHRLHYFEQWNHSEVAWIHGYFFFSPSWFENLSVLK